MPKQSPPGQTASNTYKRNPAAPRQPLPNRLVRLLNEARWIAFCFAFLYFVMILLSYHKADPGWSHESLVPRVQNLVKLVCKTWG